MIILNQFIGTPVLIRIYFGQLFSDRKVIIKSIDEDSRFHHSLKSLGSKVLGFMFFLIFQD